MIWGVQQWIATGLAIVSAAFLVGVFTHPSSKSQKQQPQKRRQVYPMLISDAIIRELLSPESPLVDQSDELRAALGPIDGYAARVALIDVREKVSPEARHILAGLSVYWQHMTAVRNGDQQSAADTYDQAQSEFKGLLNDIRRLAEVAEGIAIGYLRPGSYREACDLVRHVLGPKSKDAKRILGKIKRRRYGPWELWLKFLSDERQLLFLRNNNRTVVEKLPSRAAEQGKS